MRPSSIDVDEREVGFRELVFDRKPLCEAAAVVS